MYRFRLKPWSLSRPPSRCFRFHLTTILALLITSLGLAVLSENAEDGNSGPPNQNRASRLSKHPVVIVISFDGFRYNYFQRVETPNMDIIRDHGVSVQYMRNQFVTKTFPNHMSIATGLHVESHGVVDNTLYDPKFDMVLDHRFPEFWNFDNATTPLWTLNELQGRRSGVMMWPGSPFPFGDKETLPSKVLGWNDSYPFEARVDLVVDWITDEKEPVDLAFLYLEEPDEIAHGYGPESPEVTQYISVIDNATGYLINRLKYFSIFDKVNVILLSDHGFHEVRQEHIINYTSVLKPNTYHVYGYSPVMHILPKEGYMDEIYNSLRNHSINRNFTVYRKDEIDPLWYYSKNRRIMPIILVADLGFVFEDFRNNIKLYNDKFNLTASSDRVYGTHGYDNRKLPMHPFFMAHGPAFRAAYQGDVFDNVDIYPLICKITGLIPLPNNGSLNNVYHLLRRKGFAMGSPVGWVMGAALVIGLTVILGIMSALISGKKSRRREAIPEMSSIREFGEIGHGDKSLKSFPVNTEECQALLLSSSTEEL